MVTCKATTETFHKPPQPTSKPDSQFETKNKYICTVGRTLENAEAQLEIEGLGAVVDCTHFQMHACNASFAQCSQQHRHHASAITSALSPANQINVQVSGVVSVRTIIKR